MDIKIIRKDQQNTSNWSGGTTTQLTIFPENASYADKTFDFRLSSARVDLEESTFTKLEGVSRDIMILEGQLELTHKNRYTKILKQFDTDQFLGQWDTSSKGKVTDFNLMTTGDNKGYISHIHLSERKNHSINIEAPYNIIAIYIHNGKTSIEVGTRPVLLNEKDFTLIFTKESNPKINITAVSNSNIIISKIFSRNI